MNKQIKKSILVIDDEPKIRDILKDILEHEAYEVITAKEGEEGLRILGTKHIDLVLLDLVMPGVDGMDVLKQIVRRDPYLPVIIISAHGNIPIAMEAAQLGAVDFIEKPLEMKDLLSRVKDKLITSFQNREKLYRSQEVFERYGMIGVCGNMMDIYRMIDQAAPTNVRVLITGETGTGKERVARAIYHLSQRAEKPFLRINCAAIPSELIESELFGYKKGAFTGAQTDKAGKFQSANGGTLFLDEIGDMSPITQAKVLRTLEEGEIQPLGSTESVSVNVRVLAATNKEIEKQVDQGIFREDLYYRLNVVTIHLPLLRERKDDIPALARYFVDHFCNEHNRKTRHLTNKTLEWLVDQPWKGNVREMRNFIEKLVVMVDDDIIDFHHIKMLHELKRVEKSFNFNLSLRNARKQFEREYIHSKLIASDWDIPETAAQLGMARTALYRKMNDLGIKPIR